MPRLACIVVALLIQLVVTTSAMGATISIAPTSGPVGTVVSFEGVASECAEQPAEDAEVFLLLGNFSGSSAINPRTLVELAPDGAFAGTWAMPDPAASLARDVTTRTFEVGVRCVDDRGQHDGADITTDAPAFTYTGEPCATLQGLGQAQAPIRVDAFVEAFGACLQVTLRGTGVDNELLGNVLANVLHGLAGNDTLRGLAGDDLIRGGHGNDRAYGDGGNDRIHGDAGADVAVGGPGNDTITGGAGTDMLHGSAGADALHTADGRPGDVANGGPGTDTCTVDAGDTARACERVLRR